MNEDHLPREAPGCPDLPSARLKHAPLVTGCIGLITGLLQMTGLADALGVTVRTVRTAYGNSDETVAARIRAERVRRAQALLAVRTEPPDIAATAARVGLGRDRFTRAFQATTGQTARERCYTGLALGRVS